MGPTPDSRFIESPMETQAIGRGAITIMTVPERNWKRQCRRGKFSLDTMQTDVYADACLYSGVARIACLPPRRSATRCRRVRKGIFRSAGQVPAFRRAAS